MTSNEKWRGNSKHNSNSGAGRDGNKPYEKRDVKAILKGSRGAAKFTSDKNKSDDKRGFSKPDYKKRDDSSATPGYNRKPYENRNTSSGADKKPYEGRFNSDSSDRKPFDSRNKPAYGDRKPYEGRSSSDSSERRPYENRPKPSFGDRKPYEGRPSSEGSERRPYENRPKPAYGDRKPYEGRPNSEGSDRKPYENRSARPSFGDSRKPYGDRDARSSSSDRPYKSRPYDDSARPEHYGRSNKPQEDASTEKLAFKKPGEKSPVQFIETRFDNRKDGVSFRKPLRKREDDNYDPHAKYSNKKQIEYRKATVDPNKPIRLNKFLANAGVCSRREADEYIQAGVISVNDVVVSELGVKVMSTDKVMFHNQQVRSEKKVYLLLNKPKDCVTTVEDTHDRLTVIDLVKNACSERIYPVGRLDRNTTGVILLTNDGDLASKLTHPKYDKKKIYHIALDRALEQEDFHAILTGVSLDDGEIKADALEYVKEGDPKQVGIEIHSGQNRIVRRIFEKLGYKVIRLDRVYFAGLTKKNIQRGKYRFLSEREVNMLKMGAYE